LKLINKATDIAFNEVIARNFFKCPSHNDFYIFKENEEDSSSTKMSKPISKDS
jgi:hypothetical protein